MTTATATCPTWCSSDHSLDRHPDDVLHASEPLHTVHASADDAGRVELAWWKYEAGTRGQLSIDVRLASREHLGAAVVLTEADARQLAAKLVDLADRVAAPG